MVLESYTKYGVKEGIHFIDFKNKDFIKIVTNLILLIYYKKKIYFCREDAVSVKFKFKIYLSVEFMEKYIEMKKESFIYLIILVNLELKF